MTLFGNFLSPWLRMGMYSRLFLPIAAIIVAVSGVRYTLLIDSETASAEARYRERAQELNVYLARALEPALAEANRSALTTVLNSALLLDPDLAVAQLHSQNITLEVRRAPRQQPGDTAPQWLVEWRPIAALRLTHEVPAGTAREADDAELTLSFDPALPLAHVWQAVRQQAVLSAINITIIYVLLGLIIWANKRMLARLNDATARFQRGEHGVRMKVWGTTEARAVANTFNNMAEQVQSLVRDQRLRQSRLNEQLAQTLYAREQLQAQKDRIEVTLASIGDGVITTDLAGKVESLNAAATQLTGWNEGDARGKDLHRTFVLANNFGQHSLLKAMSSIYAGGGVVKIGNQSLRNLSGQTIAVEYTAAPIRADNGQVQGSVLVFRDVSEKRQLIQQMSWQSQHDVLTGLPNRTALALRFEQEIARAREDETLLAVCLFDLDHFQQVNQSMGQAAGDEILKQAASRLHDFAGHRHYAARLGGDEFVLLLPGLSDRAAIEQTMSRLMEALARDYVCDGEAVQMSASVGVALYGGNDVSADNLLRHADQALYQAKITGRNRYHFFDADLDEQVRTHHNRRSEVRSALRAGELRLYYQPKLDMRKGRVIGMEALLRWQHPDRGIVGPAEFLPTVEHSDVIVDIGEWVLREALRQLSAWRNAHPDWVVSVNIAARHFQRPDFVERLTAILAEFPCVPPQMLELEILESSALSDIGHVRGIMLSCQALGIRFALDDFGTGYSSMSYLKRLPADVLKIDQSFVRNMLVDRDDLHLVCAVIGLARSFGREVIAEGVESVAHGALLMRLGCDLVQGYGIARPMPAHEVMNWIGNFDAAPAWQAAALLPPIQSLHGDSGEIEGQLALFAQG